MSSKCTLINESNFATYSSKYNTHTADGKPVGSCVNPGNKSFRDGGGCDEGEFACFANHTLTKKREQLDANLEDIYNPRNGRSATYDSNYQTTMLTGVVWAMLGTTVLYYAFTKI
jgi:hypothetical protein